MRKDPAEEARYYRLENMKLCDEIAELHKQVDMLKYELQFGYGRPRHSDDPYRLPSYLAYPKGGF